MCGGRKSLQGERAGENGQRDRSGAAGHRPGRSFLGHRERTQRAPRAWALHLPVWSVHCSHRRAGGAGAAPGEGFRGGVPGPRPSSAASADRPWGNSCAGKPPVLPGRERMETINRSASRRCLSTAWPVRPTRPFSNACPRSVEVDVGPGRVGLTEEAAAILVPNPAQLRQECAFLQVEVRVCKRVAVGGRGQRGSCRLCHTCSYRQETRWGAAGVPSKRRGGRALGLGGGRVPPSLTGTSSECVSGRISVPVTRPVPWGDGLKLL